MLDPTNSVYADRDLVDARCSNLVMLLLLVFVEVVHSCVSAECSVVLVVTRSALMEFVDVLRSNG